MASGQRNLMRVISENEFSIIVRVMHLLRRGKITSDTPNYKVARLIERDLDESK